MKEGGWQVNNNFEQGEDAELTVKQAARMLGLGYMTVYDTIRREGIPHRLAQGGSRRGYTILVTRREINKRWPKDRREAA